MVQSMAVYEALMRDGREKRALFDAAKARDDTVAAAVAAYAQEIERLKAHAVILAATAEEMERERCAQIALNGCLAPPDGGSPTEAERLLCEEIARRIRDDYRRTIN